MSAQIPLDRFTKELFECLDETFNEHHGVYLDKGTSLFETLKTVSAAEASRRAGANCATIAAQVEHVRFYLDVLNDVMQNRAVGKVDWREIWNRVATVTDDEWHSLLERLEKSYKQVMDTIRTYDYSKGEYGISGSLAILTHTAYHLGGIRQALCAIRSNSAADPI